MGLIAVFDFDGTLIREDSMVLFFRRYYKFSWENTGILIKLIWETVKFFLRINSQKQYKEKFINFILMSLKNKNLQEITWDFSNHLLKKIFKDAIVEIKKLKEKGYETILLSASLDFYLKKVREALGFTKLICTETTLKEGRMIITGDNCYGENKILKLLGDYEQDKVDWKNSYCYSDNLSDSDLLSLFGNPIAVNNIKLAVKNPGFKYLSWK